MRHLKFAFRLTLGLTLAFLLFLPSIPFDLLEAVVRRIFGTKGAVWGWCSVPNALLFTLMWRLECWIWPLHEEGHEGSWWD